MFKTIINAWKVKDIRTKMLYTLLLIVVYRLGSFIPVPSVNGEKLGELIASYDFLSFLNLFSGGSLNNFSLFAMGISPYITASIILQLLTIAFPSLEKLSKEEDGREKIEKITRIVGVVLALIQSVSIVVGLNSANGDLIKKITIFGTSGFGTFMNGFMPYVITGICCTAGTAFLMWMGERITEKGIGNGVSILIFASIVSSVPNVVINLINGTFHIIPTTNGLAYKWWYGIVVILVVLILTVGIVTVEKAVRRIPVQYAKRVVGRKMYGGQSTHIPIKVNMSGVMPVIFASAILSIPSTIRLFVGEPTGFWKGFFNAFSSTGWLYSVLYLLLIVVFAYFYMTIQYNPIEMANNLRTNNGTIPGIRPGRPTAEFISKILSKITLIGAIFLAFVAILPILYSNLTGMYGLSMGGTSVIIMVGVALETVKQIESQMMMRHYKGFLD
jgi:preprotein translocase subunit SecY